MPTVPRADTPTVEANTLQPVAFSAPQANNFAIDQGRQSNQAVSQIGDLTARMAVDAQQQANQLRVDDALNKAREAAQRLTFDKDIGYTNVRGEAALKRDSGKPLADEYADNLKTHLDTLAKDLGNDQQRQAFQMRANDLLTGFHGNAIQHESTQFRDYSLSVREGTIANRMNEIGLYYKDPRRIDEAVQSIQAAVYDQGKILGKSGEWVEAQTRKMTSNAHTFAVQTALEKNDVVYADGYLKKYAKQMDAEDILRVEGMVTKEVNNRIAVTTATDVVSRVGPRMVTSEADRAFNILLGTESGNKQFAADGTPLTSPKGAIGIAQVMPKTGPEAAKLANMEWDENRYRNDPTYNMTLGRAYFQKQLQDNGGDLAKAYAAYNAGPGALQAAIKKAEQSHNLNKTDPNVQARDWIEFMPAETRAYVAKNMKSYESGQGQHQRPTLAEIHDQVRQRVGTDNPQRLRAAIDESTRQFGDMEKAVKQREEDAVATAMRGILETGGRWSDLPASVRAAVPPKEIDNVVGFAQKIAKGDDTTSLWLYNKLTGNPSELAKMGDNEFFALRRELSESDFKHFSNERNKLRGGVGGNSAGDLNSSAIKNVLDSRLRMLQIDPTPKDDGGGDAARIGAIRRFTDQYFMAAQKEAGKKFTDAEVAQHIDSLFAKNTEFRGWFSTKSGPMLTMKTSDIDGTTKDNIKAAFKRQGIDSPTDAQILNAFWNMKVARK